MIDKLIDDKVQDLVNDHVCFLLYAHLKPFVIDRTRPQYLNLTQDAGLHEVFVVCFARTSDVSFNSTAATKQKTHLILFYRNQCPEFPPQNPKLFTWPCTSFPFGYRMSESCIRLALRELRSSLSVLRCTTPLWRGCLIRTRGCARRLGSRVIGMKLLQLYLEVRGRSDKLGYCGRFLGYRIRKAHEKRNQLFFVESDISLTWFKSPTCLRYTQAEQTLNDMLGNEKQGQGVNGLGWMNDNLARKKVNGGRHSPLLAFRDLHLLVGRILQHKHQDPSDRCHRVHQT